MTLTSRSGPLLWTTAVLFFLLGLAMAMGGVWLALLGGSFYYLIAGAGVIATAWLVLRQRRAALWFYALVLTGTVVWSLFEVRFDWWQLVPRIAVWLALGVWLLLPWLHRRLLIGSARTASYGQASLPLWLAVVLAVVVGGVGFFTDYYTMAGAVPEASMAASTAADAPGVAPNDWVAYGRSAYGDRYAPAKQITPANVAQLQVAWTFHTGDLKGAGDPTEIANEVTPLKANGKLYICTPHNIVIALDPDTGKELWRYDPKINRDAKTYQHMICRGVAYYDSSIYPASSTAAVAPKPTPKGAVAMEAIHFDSCPRRIFAPTADATIVSINADNGQPCTDFGERGVIGLYQGMSMTQRGFLNPTSPPLVTQHVLIVSASVTDNDSTNEPSGVIRGYDIDTGRLLWNWDAANPEETAPLQPGQTYKRNSPNSWSVSSADEKLGLVYIPMGNQTPDMWGGDRYPEGERFNSAIVALDIATGKLRWVYQTVHHDLWDMDIGGQPSLVDLDRPEGKVPALIASTKRGDLYVLDRRDGKLIVPAPEQAAPQGAAEGDHSAATQPFSQLSFKPERALRESDMWGTNPFDQLVCRIKFKQLRYDGIFTPPSERGSLVYPGNYGVFDWGGITIDPVRQVLVGNPNYMAFVSKLYRRDQVDAKGGTGIEHGLQPMTGTPFAVDLQPLLSPLGIPCQAPPWGYVAAVDLKTMQKVWMHKNGTVVDNAPLPIPLPLGVPSLGGAIITGGGVAFMSASLDYYLRAYDVRTGKTLWESRLPAGGQATPMSYVSDQSGRQYVVIMAGGHGSLGTKMGDTLIAYALPQTAAPAK
ncbi:glucose/quinate/shikimate family membrane-bound PQQ-dependent dehydrogenase [Dyella tabacisoli]|uniref:Glucose/quinate/shikimate family membrane-bound PQQ-dependent dehydrogenase n=1 Tax=Dyella tabacisoli TaxID=2282381 RepID=A0A369UL84_9GAMM|nr:glucose/quinate/shikimate family membrane-bound PQQ-dependent dehydrogenase [Dyella tabacisoli]RDD81093.1 glucose/quinate/shikimate family membrane-bound PQQ-dependent dehydrogenase [Dyella tabacisoli]